jgi:cyanophycinase-like exopeptidase
MSEHAPGPVVLFGSGETSPSGRKIFDAILKKLPHAPHMALLETPAGFELNSDRVIGRVAEFIAHRLQNYNPKVTIIPARKRGTPLSPDNEEVVSPILAADLIFMGPGSPSYAVRQLKDSLAWDYILARHRLGATLALASSAAVAISAYALPVYEIYKVGEDIHWKDGLDFFGQYGLPLIFIPHWNNNDGGDELDTRHCFMGAERFLRLLSMLPSDVTIVGIDEKTGLIMDLEAGECRVLGTGGVTLIHTGHAHVSFGPDQAATGLDEIFGKRSGHVHIYYEGEVFPLDECCSAELRSTLTGLPPTAWKQAKEVEIRLKSERKETNNRKPKPVSIDDVPHQVRELVDMRQKARQSEDWATADALRDEIARQGWKIMDTPQGPQVIQDRDLLDNRPRRDDMMGARRS